jgi:hypothetical protein
MRFLEKIVSELLDGIRDRNRRPFDFGTAPAGLRDFDLRVGQVDRIFAAPGFDAFDLTAVAVTVEPDKDRGDARAGERVEQRGLVGWPDGFGKGSVLAVFFCPIAGGVD